MWLKRIGVRNGNYLKYNPISVFAKSLKKCHLNANTTKLFKILNINIVENVINGKYWKNLQNVKKHGTGSGIIAKLVQTK